jgi:hypothetical protein
VRPRTRVRFPPPPPRPFELTCELCLKRRRIRRRLCVPISRSSFKGLRELVKLDVVRVLLGRVGPRMAHERLERHEVTAALPEEAISEAVPKLVRRQPPDAGPCTYSVHHPRQRLDTRRLFRIRAPARALERRNPSESTLVQPVLVSPASRAVGDRMLSPACPDTLLKQALRITAVVRLDGTSTDCCLAPCVEGAMLLPIRLPCKTMDSIG